MKQPFFIVGPPRSRTAWLANLFTTENIHCFHEISAVYPVDRWETVLKVTGKRYVGVSEPHPRTILEAKKIFPECKIVVIERPVKEAFKAMVKALCWLKQSDHKRGKAFTAVLRSQEAELRRLKKIPGALVVKFNELNQNEAIARIWKHCIPDIEPDHLRIAQLQDLRVTIKYESLKDFDEVIRHFADRKMLLEDGLFGHKTERAAVIKSLQKLWLRSFVNVNH